MQILGVLYRIHDSYLPSNYATEEENIPGQFVDRVEIKQG